MSTHNNPAATAAQDQLDAAQIELRTYVNSLSAEDLLAELRCAVGRLTEHLATAYGSGSPEAVTLIAISLGLRRFDLDGGTTITDEGDPAGTVPHKPFPFAVHASAEDLCHSPHGGISRRVNDIHEIVHSYMHTRGDG